MRVSSYAVGRQDFYDRNATGNRSRIFILVGPHVQTTRFTITIPAAKKAILESAFVRIQQNTLSAVTGLASFATDTYFGADRSTCLYAFFYTSTVTLQSGSAILSTMPTIYAGEAITGLSENTSTGGNQYILADVKYTQFDA